LEPPILTVERLVAGYGRIRILDEISFALRRGEVVGLVGHNGMGKTTLLRALIGHVPANSGQIHFAGHDVTHAGAAFRARLGLGYVPQGRQIFPDLTVLENLRVGEAARGGASDIPTIFQRFPQLARLAKRQGRTLSGGEQQFLALARCLAGRPRAILLDEPSEGIQPSITKQIAELLRELAEQDRLAVLLVEQDLHLVSAIAERVFVMRKGRLVTETTSAALADPAMIRKLLGM